MPAPTLAKLRNIGVIAHIDAGKTTATDRILFHTGRTHRLGSVDEGTTVTDWMEQERERGITIVSAAVSTQWRDCLINLIDTPGHIDFTAEVQRALRVLDGCVVVFDAVHGVQPQSETVWRQAERHHVPRLCFINKMDRIGADFSRAAASIGERLGAAIACLQLPLGQEGQFHGLIDLASMAALNWTGETGQPPRQTEIPPDLRATAETARANLIERVAEVDDLTLDRYLAGEQPDAQELRAAVRRATLANRLFPVLCGAALRDIGIQPLLDAVVDFLPSPLDIAATHGTDPANGNSVAVRADEREPLAALVFKVVIDPYVGHLSYVRVYSGVIRSGMAVHNATRNRKQRVARLLRMYANHREEVDSVHAGDIAAILGLNQSYTGDTLCEPQRQVVLEAISFPEPVIRAVVEPRTAADHERLEQSLRRLTEEDPTFHLDVDEESGQIVIAGMGELHIEVLLERLRREYGVQALMGRPLVAYKEAISAPVEAVEARFAHHAGGRGQYGHVILSLAPGEPGTGIRFENAVSASEIPAQFVSAVEQGIRDAARAGVLAGYAVADVAVRLIGGSSHPSESTEIAFRAAATTAFRDGLRQGEPRLLEPVLRIEVLVPREYTGAVLNQLVARRAEIQNMDTRPGGIEAVLGQVPLAEMFGYVTELRSATQGRGQFTMEFDHYAPLPAALARAVLSGEAFR